MNTARILGLAALVFGAATLVSGGKMVFGSPEVWASAGVVITWILYFNFAAGFIYILTGLFALLGRAETKMMAAGLAVANTVMLLLLLGFIATGGAFETRTLAAMILRSGFWVGLALYFRRPAS